MEKQRLEAFSDGVIAIIITIMVLELKTPAAASFSALLEIAPAVLAYGLGFVGIGIFWNNHHHMLQATKRINGRVLWANLFFLFWLSLFPFAIRWIGESGFKALPVAAYGMALNAAGLGYMILQNTIIAADEANAGLARAVGVDRKGKISAVLTFAATGLAFVRPWIAVAIYIAVALMWFVPGRRIETRITTP
ncbi:MAG: TMEM175 family protein [Caulobacteraceae bacterium]